MPNVPEGEVTLVVHIKKSLHKKLKRWCVDNEITIQDVITELVKWKVE